MSRRDNVAARCATCQMFAALCICELVPRLVTRTRLVLLVHYREARKPTNTGQLAARSVVGSRVEIVGDRARPLSVPLVDPEERAVLLYPSDDAIPLTAVAAEPEPVTLIVPDGNWRQAGKMGRRIPGLEAVRRVTLPELGATEYRLRAELREGGLATLEAIARALRILEGDRGPEIEEALLGVFREMVRRTLQLRGVE